MTPQSRQNITFIRVIYDLTGGEGEPDLQGLYEPDDSYI